MTATEIRNLLAHLLAGAAGGTEAEWRGRIEVTKLPIATNPRSNWRVVPTGTLDEVQAILAAADVVRAEHTYVE